MDFSSLIWSTAYLKFSTWSHNSHSVHIPSWKNWIRVEHNVVLLYYCNALFCFFFLWFLQIVCTLFFFSFIIIINLSCIQCLHFSVVFVNTRYSITYNKDKCLSWRKSTQMYQLYLVLVSRFSFLGKTRAFLKTPLISLGEIYWPGWWRRDNNS